MPPLIPILPPAPTTPRVICYHQTHHLPDGTYISILPLLTERTGLTHLILAAIHLNDPPGTITLNDDPPDAPRNTTLWDELLVLHDSGIKVLGMLGGAAAGTFARLDAPDPFAFEAHYGPLRDMVRRHAFDGLDLDVEEPMSLAGIVRLIDRLRADFGPGFLITLAPVASALCGGRHLSGFDYEALEVLRGGSVSWYNVQFYCGWGAVESCGGWFERVVGRGWAVGKVVVGTVTNPGNGEGWVGMEVLRGVLGELVGRWDGFGGVMGWEYFNALPGGVEKPWEWAGEVRRCLDWYGARRGEAVGTRSGGGVGEELEVLG